MNHPIRLLSLLSCALLALQHNAVANDKKRRPANHPRAAIAAPRQEPTPLLPDSPLHGWDYVIDKLRKDGFKEERLRHAYLDPRMPYLTLVPFSVHPRESSASYRHFTKSAEVQLARDFLTKNKKAFDEAEKRFHVSRFVVVSILLIESHFGRHTGQLLALHRLSRLASVADPANLKQNFHEQQLRDRTVTYEQVVQRAAYLEKTFYPEILSLFDIAEKAGVDVLDIRGSSAGAIGMPQFLPSAMIKFGIDGDSDHRLSLYEDADAIASTSNFLHFYGWKEPADRNAKRRVIMRYNKSEAYVEAVLGVAARLDGKLTASPRGKK